MSAGNQNKGAQASRLCGDSTSQRSQSHTQAGRLCSLGSFATQPPPLLIAPNQNRREFLRTAVRAALLGTVGLIGAVLVRRQQDCTARGGCDGCAASDGCPLPWKVVKR